MTHNRQVLIAIACGFAFALALVLYVKLFPSGWCSYDSIAANPERLEICTMLHAASAQTRR